MIKTCSTGHNEVCWEHGNHPKGCPVCSQIERFKDYEPYLGSVAKTWLQNLESEKRDLTCKLRDANIEIEKLKSVGWYSNDVALSSAQEVKKQRDDLLIKVEQLERMDRSSAASGTLMAAKQKIFALQTQVCDLLEQNARITMNAQMREDGYLILEVRRQNARIEELLVELEKKE